MAKAHLEKTLVALAGEFLVAGQLCFRGYLASIALKNYPGVEIFCLNPADGKRIAIQVNKTKQGDRQYYVPENEGKVEQPSPPPMKEPPAKTLDYPP